MKIAFCMKKEYLDTGGGGRVQILKTKEYLEKYTNHIIYITHEPQKIEPDTDIVHIFNILDFRFLFDFIAQARKINAKICFSTIYWDFSYSVLLAGKTGCFFGYNYSYWLYIFEKSLAAISSKLIKLPFYLTKEARQLYGKILQEVDAILPNSIEEGEQLTRYTGLNLEHKIHPIVNAVDISIKHPCNKTISSVPQNYILEVGRIEPVKNQLMLVKALFNEKNIPIVFLGKNHFPNSRYSRELYAVARKRGNVYFYDEIPYESVPQFYKQALVHVLPSLRESPGLVSLESLAYGCKAVVSDRRFGPVDTYFGNDVTQVNPISDKSIRNGILNEINIKRNMEVISKKIIERFSWGKTAEQTNKVYKMLKSNN